MIGRFEFSERSRENLIKYCELLSLDQEKYVSEAQKYIFINAFVELLKLLPEDKRRELSEKISQPELFQSHFRMSFDESKIKEYFVKFHNQYLDTIIKESGGNFTDEVIKQIEALKL